MSYFPPESRLGASYAIDEARLETDYTAPLPIPTGDSCSTHGTPAYGKKESSVIAIDLVQWGQMAKWNVKDSSAESSARH